jgi:hypothetical protein
MGAQLQAREVDGTIAAMAGRQHGVVARRQVLALGLGRRAIGHAWSKGACIPYIEACTPWAIASCRSRVGGWPWHRERLVVELDGYTAHATRAAFEGDRARDRRLQASGWRVVRITWRQLHDEPQEVAAELRALLVRARATPAAARPAPSG